MVKIKMKTRITIFSLAVVLIFSFIAVSTLLRPGLPPTHDGEYHVIRFYEFDRVIRDGSWYPRWAPDLNNGYGVPLFNYVYPFPNYVSFILHLIGFSFIDAFKISMLIAGLIGSIFFYFWMKEYFSEKASVAASIFYTFSPYHFVDVFIRGSIGEVWALSLFPGFLLSITRLYKKRSKVYLVLSVLFLSCTIFSHNIVGLMFFLFALFYMGFLMIIAKEKKVFLIEILLIVILSLSLSAVFWLPALLETNYVKGLQLFVTEQNFPEVYQLIIPSWGSGFSPNDLGNFMSPQIGLANIFAVFISFFCIVFYIYKKKENTLIAVFFLALFFVIFFLMTPFSLFIWQNVPFMNYFQFPWRFLSLEILISSFLSGFILHAFNSKILTVMIVVFVFLTTIGYAKPAYYMLRNDRYYLMRSNFIDGTNSPGNLFNTIWMQKIPARQKEKISFKDNHVNIISQKIRISIYTFEIYAKKRDIGYVHTAYFPGWKVLIDKKSVDIRPSREGGIAFFVPNGKHKITVLFENTLIRTIGEILSFSSFILIICLLSQNAYARMKR